MFQMIFFTIHVFDLMKTMHWLKTNYQVDGSNVWNFNVWKHNWFEHIKRVESSELLHKWVMSCCVLTRCGIKWTVHLFSAPYPTVEIPRCHHQPWHGPFSFAKTNGWSVHTSSETSLVAWLLKSPSLMIEPPFVDDCITIFVDQTSLTKPHKHHSGCLNHHSWWNYQCSWFFGRTIFGN